MASEAHPLCVCVSDFLIAVAVFLVILAGDVLIFIFLSLGSRFALRRFSSAGFLSNVGVEAACISSVYIHSFIILSVFLSKVGV